MKIEGILKKPAEAVERIINLLANEMDLTAAETFSALVVVIFVVEKICSVPIRERVINALSNESFIEINQIDKKEIN